MNISVPQDGRPQFTLADVAVNVGLGRRTADAFEQISPSHYVLANSWPAAKPSPGGFSGAVVASQAAPETTPKSSAAARAIWPALP
jgi:hypothetical protein